MNFKEMTVAQLEERKSAIATELDSEGADLNALEEEVRGINAELETRKAEAKKREEIRNAVAMGKGTVQEEVTEEREMSAEEIRNSKEYIDAYAKYVKTEDDSECRALLTENVVGGTIPVPTIVENEVKHAWEKLGVLDLVKKTFVKGNVAVGVELSGDDAQVHTEGGVAVTEEELTIVTVELKPQSIKKWVSVSDEFMDMTSEAFLQYVYQELTYRIGKKIEDLIVTAIANMDGDSTVPQATLTKAPAIDTITQAIGLMSDEANEISIVMNKATWALFKGIQKQANYAQDIFEGCKVLWNNKLDSYALADAGDAYAIVGDFNYGVQVNFPNGYTITIKDDDKTLMTQDLVRILGRMFAGFGVVAPRAFCVISKPSQ